VKNFKRYLVFTVIPELWNLIFLVNYQLAMDDIKSFRNYAHYSRPLAIIWHPLRSTVCDVNVVKPVGKSETAQNYGNLSTAGQIECTGFSDKNTTTSSH